MKSLPKNIKTRSVDTEAEESYPENEMLLSTMAARLDKVISYSSTLVNRSIDVVDRVFYVERVEADDARDQVIDGPEGAIDALNSRINDLMAVLRNLDNEISALERL